MNMGKKEFLRNESVYVRSSAAGNPNTSGAVLAELAKDSDNFLWKRQALSDRLRLHTSHDAPYGRLPRKQPQCGYPSLCKSA